MKSIGGKWKLIEKEIDLCKIKAKKVICSTSDHCFSIVNGVIQDTYNYSKNEKIYLYGYWVIK